MAMWIAVLAVSLAVACAPTGAASSASPSPVASAASGPPSTSPLPGTTFTMPTDRDMIEFFADQRSLIAYSSKDAPPPYDSKIQRADPATNVWRTVHQTDARFMHLRVAVGRIALLEYREPLQGGGAYSVKVMVIDLATGVPSTIDGYAMSAASFRGGGGAPRRPNGALALGPDRIAWTRLIEDPAGAVRGELAVAQLSEPSRRVVVASSSEWVSPLSVDAHRLVYVLGGEDQDELHVRDLDSGSDRVAATAAVGNTAVTGPPGIDRAVVSGSWAVWIEQAAQPADKGAPQANATAHALDLATGSQRRWQVSGSYCPFPASGARYVAWYCGTLAAPNPEVYDARTLEPVRIVPPDAAVGVIASGDGLIWFTPPPGTRTVTLFRPRS